MASRARVDPFIVMDVFAAANARGAAGADVIHMEVGEPPAAVLAAARQALGRSPLGYTEALGRPQLRAAIVEHYDSTALCAELLETADLALAPGADFDSEHGHRFVRLSFAGTHAQVAAGAERLAAWLRRRQRDPRSMRL